MDKNSSFEKSYPSAEMQMVYSTAQANWAGNLKREKKKSFPFSFGINNWEITLSAQEKKKMNICYIVIIK